MWPSNVRRYFDLGEVETSFGRAMVEERYTALRRQVPVIYVLAVANLCGLELATVGSLQFGLNFPTLITLWALGRTAQWLRTSATGSHAVMLRRLRQTCWLAALICISVCAWCLHLIAKGDGSADMAVILFGGFTALGTAYGLSAVPAAARLPIFVLALPLAGMALLSRDSQFVGAALSLAIVAVLVLRLLSTHNAQFADVIASRSAIAGQQELAENARQEAVLAATTDFLTGLPNRRAFIAALDSKIESGDDTFAVAILDLDRFKAINDTLGHLSGDSLLQIVAKRLESAAGSDAVAARLGGDEFGLLLRNVTDAEEARSICTRILREIDRSTLINGRHIAIAASIGVGLSRQGSARTPSRALADADLALYEAKRSSGERVAVFEPRMEAPYQRRVQIERALRLEDVHERIYLVYQPILDLETGRTIANEALARWRDSDLGEVSPAEFVPIAEQLNLIGNISDHLMENAFSEAAKWPSSIRLSFNLSAVQLCSPRSADCILAALRTAGLANDRLQVEVTETSLLVDFVQARENLARLRLAGVTIVLDDFGAGYSSIGYLRELSFDQIKLDGALITAAQASAEGKRLLLAVIGLCQALGVSTVAEHIENEEQHKLVVSLGCAAGQGFWLQPPMSAAAARDWSSAAASLDVREPPQLDSTAA